MPMGQSAFELVDRRRVPTLNLELQSYRHPSGARHLHLACDDDNNAFMVAFPTIPTDSTGVAHILEHTTLCGSQRYPVRDPFFMMLRRSLNTFMNAFTSSDSTAYPFATRNRKDFDNLLQVYLDAVFFPLLEPLDFAQEGCRVELADPQGGALVFKGVVFNEMKGAMSSPVAQLWHHLQASLFPDTPYRFNSGGDPAEIPNLTHAALREFHARHYHPSQAVFLTYGCFDPLAHQARFEADALSRFPAVGAGQRWLVDLQPPLPQPRAVEHLYAVDDVQDADAATHVVCGWVLGESADPRAALEAQILASLLLEHSASPLRHYLETTELARAPSELCGVDDSGRQIAFYAGVEGSEPGHANGVEQGILAVIAEVAVNGVQRAALEAALDRIELAQRDVGGDGYPFGLQLMSRILPGAMYQRDPVALLDIDGLLEELRREVAEPGYSQRLVRRMLLDNPHRVRLVMRPDTTRRDAERAAEEARLAAMAATLDDVSRRALAEAADALAVRQARTEDPDALPRITLADVPAGEAPVAHVERALGSQLAHCYTRGTNGVVRAQIAIDLPALDADELATLAGFSSYLADFGSGKETYLETQARRAQVGSIGASASIRGHLNEVDSSAGQLILAAKGLKRHTPALVENLAALLPTVRLDEVQRLRELISQTRADLDQAITDRGHQLAMHGAMRGLSRGAWLADLWDGPSHVLALQALDDAGREDDAPLQALMARFSALKDKLLAAPRRVLLVGEDDAIATSLEAFQRAPWVAGSDPGAAPREALVLPAPSAAEGTAWLANGEVNFCAKAYGAVPEGHADAPALAVLARFLSDGFLHPAIREKGGAYGGGASFDADNAAFAFYSYRDPRLADTLADFDRALDWLQGSHAPQLLEEAVLGVIRRLDKPRSPAGVAVHWFYSALHGRDAAFRAQFRAAVLATRLDDLRRVAQRYLVPARGVVGVVSHAGERAALDTLGLRQLSF